MDFSAAVHPVIGTAQSDMGRFIYNLVIDDNTTTVSYLRNKKQQLTSRKKSNPNVPREKNHRDRFSRSNIFDTSQALIKIYRVTNFVAYRVQNRVLLP